MIPLLTAVKPDRYQCEQCKTLLFISKIYQWEIIIFQLSNKFNNLKLIKDIKIINLYNSKKNQYPAHYTAARESGYKKDIAEGRMCADCVGLIKALE